jgi:hypothetical protein
MKSISRLGTLMAALLWATSSAQALPLLDLTSALTLSDPTQLGRLSRNGMPQDWAGDEVFPGVLNTSVTYHYHAFAINVGLAPFIQISVDSESGNTFASAYDTAYLPNSAGSPNFGFNINWLGDAGFSGNLFPGDPAFFQVVVPINHTLLVIVNNTLSANVGVGDPFRLLVEGFADTEFTEPVPEPTTLVLCATGLALLGIRRLTGSRLSAVRRR